MRSILCVLLVLCTVGCTDLPLNPSALSTSPAIVGVTSQDGPCGSLPCAPPVVDCPVLNPPPSCPTI